MTVKEKIIQVIEPLLEDGKYFIVEVTVSPSKIRQKITVLIDSDEGISIDECAEISRQLSDIIDAQEIVSNAFTLEVSSPGIDYPLSMPRQYQKNIGRTLRVILKDGSEKRGTLQKADEEGFQILEELLKKKKDQISAEFVFKYDEINKAEVQIKF